VAIRRFLVSAVYLLLLASAAGGRVPAIAVAQDDPCAGLPEYSQAMLAEEERYTGEIKAIFDLNDLRALATATPQQLTNIVEAIDTHLKNLDAIDPPAFAETWHMAYAEEGDLTQALFADGALNGIFSVLIDYYNQSIRSDKEIAAAREAATAICADFDAFATEFDMVDGEADGPAPGYAPWSHCEGLDDLGVAIDRANLQGMVDIPFAVDPLIEFAADWEVDPSIDWNVMQFYSLGAYYERVAQYLEQLTPPSYAAQWLQSVIDLDRAVGAIIFGASGEGIMAASAANGGEIPGIDQAAADGIAAASQTCPEFSQFAEAYG
jgi:hypothetical protein